MAAIIAESHERFIQATVFDTTLRMVTGTKLFWRLTLVSGKSLLRQNHNG